MRSSREDLRACIAAKLMPRLGRRRNVRAARGPASSATILFLDGNKGMGFVIGVLFLELNGFDFKASEGDATANGFGGNMLDEASYPLWLPENVNRRK
jgi:hypothetical protein